MDLVDLKMPVIGSGVELYIGGPIEHESERLVLDRLLSVLTACSSWSVILANLEIDGRQIDFVVCTTSQTLVIEAKRYSRRIRGTVNGSWKVHLGGDTWKSAPNAYRQVLDQKNRLRDALQRFDRSVAEYPNASVVICPEIPEGSELPPNDHKVSVVNLSAIKAQLSRRSGFRAEQDFWTSFAKSIDLEQIFTVESSHSERLIEEERVLDDYRHGFEATYLSDVESYRSDSYLVGGEESDTQRVLATINRDDENLLILGPSGCGKSMFGKIVALDALRSGGIPVIVGAKNFAGKLNETIASEISLIGGRSFKALLPAARRRSVPITLVVDGYNECPDGEKLTLTRSVAAFVRWHSAKLAVSAQEDPVRVDLLNVARVSVREPTKLLKAEIARTSAGNNVDRMSDLLDSISSGLEANLVGKVGLELPRGSSRFALFDAFARRMMGTASFDGIRLLAAVALMLVERLTFSTSVRELHRLAASEGIASHILDRIIASKLITVRSDRVSFGHELHFAAFCAEAVIRKANGDVEKVLSAMKSPKFAFMKNLLPGAIDDPAVLGMVLDQTDDEKLLLDSLMGVGGIAARQHLLARRELLLATLKDEARGLKFAIGDFFLNRVGVIEETTYTRSDSDLAFIRAVASSDLDEQVVAHLLEACEAMDTTLSRSFSELRPQALEEKIRLRTGLFASAYVHPYRSAGLTVLVSHISSGGAFTPFRRQNIINTVLQEFEYPNSNGQIYLLLSLARFADNRELLVPFIVPLLGDKWKRLPYHLQLKIVDFLHYIPEPDENDKSLLIEALHGLIDHVNVFLTADVAETLERLGALDEEVSNHGEEIRSELRQILAGEINSDNCARAWKIYECQFDHPFSSAYCEIVEELAETEAKRLRLMACHGAGTLGLFLAPLIEELSAYRDLDTATAFTRWTMLPPPDSFMPQDAMSVFVWAHIALGRIAVDLPMGRGDASSEASACLLAFGEIYYWVSRSDIVAADADDVCRRAFNVLIKGDQVAALSALYDVVGHFYGADRRPSIVDRFPNETLTICRNALLRRQRQVGYFPFHFNYESQCLNFAIGLIGRFGSQTDMQLLRNICDEPKLGESAFKAIQAFEKTIS